MVKLAQIIEQSSGARQVCLFFPFCSLYKKNRFHVAVGLFSRSQKPSKFGKNITDTEKKKSPVNVCLWLMCQFFVFNTFWHHLGYISEQAQGNIESIILLNRPWNDAILFQTSCMQVVWLPGFEHFDIISMLLYKTTYRGYCCVIFQWHWVLNVHFQ